MKKILFTILLLSIPLTSYALNYGELVGTTAYTGYWRMNGNSTDSSGNANNGTDSSMSYSLAGGYLSKGGVFNGSTAQIATANNIVINGTNVITVRVIYYLNATSSGYMRIASNAGAFGDNFILGKTNANAIRWLVNGNDTNAINITPKKWYYVVGTWDGTNKVLYVYDLITGSLTTQTTAVGGTFSNSTVHPVEIGSSVGDEFWNGNLDELIVEKRAWTAKETQKDFNQLKGRYKPSISG